MDREQDRPVPHIALSRETAPFLGSRDDPCFEGDWWNQQYAERRAYVYERYGKSPLAMRRAERLFRGGAFAGAAASRVITPADAIGERDLFIYSLSCLPESFRFPGAPHRLHLESFLSGIGGLLEAAQVFLWRNAVADCAIGMKLPDCVIGPEGWPYPIMWWTFEDSAKSYTVNTETNEILHVHTNGMLVAVTDSDVVVFGLGGECNDEAHAHPDGLMDVSAIRVPFGTRCIDGKWDCSGSVSQFRNEAYGRAAATVLKMVSFLNSKYICSDPVRMLRSERRSLIREGRSEEAEQVVRVVELRSREQSGSDSDCEHRDWSSRWWVRGHIRAQWYPGAKCHKLIWIAPYLKGPEEKPIAEKVYSVVR